MAFGKPSTRESNKDFATRDREEVILGMFDFWAGIERGQQSLMDRLVARKTGDEMPKRERTSIAYQFGRDLASDLREVVRDGRLVEWDELGELVHGEVGMVDHAANVGGELVEQATGGLVTPGDEGAGGDGIEDKIARFFGG